MDKAVAAIRKTVDRPAAFSLTNTDMGKATRVPELHMALQGRGVSMGLNRGGLGRTWSWAATGSTGQSGRVPVTLLGGRCKTGDGKSVVCMAEDCKDSDADSSNEAATSHCTCSSRRCPDRVLHKTVSLSSMSMDFCTKSTSLAWPMDRRKTINKNTC